MRSIDADSDELETEWRKTPTHQGGFLLDGGVHFTAGIRLLLGPKDQITRLSAFTNQLQKHLPPVDTVDATLKTKTGATGTISISFGTTLTGSEWTVGCDGGSVSVSGSTITTNIDGKEEKTEVKDERSGVPPEVRKWGEALAAGTTNERQKPEEALADLELVRTTPVDIEYFNANSMIAGEYASERGERWCPNRLQAPAVVHFLIKTRTSL